MTSKVAIVLALILVVSFFVNYSLYDSNQKMTEKISELNSQIDHFQKQQGQIQKEIEQLRTEMQSESTSSLPTMFMLALNQ